MSAIDWTDKGRLSRHDGPQTSAEAALSLDTTALEQLVVLALQAAPNGLISDDILAKYPEIGYGSLTPRYAALKRKKIIRLTGEMRVAKSGRRQLVMIINNQDDAQEQSWTQEPLL